MKIFRSSSDWFPRMEAVDWVLIALLAAAIAVLAIAYGPFILEVM